jgi:hypothetical protein
VGKGSQSIRQASKGAASIRVPLSEVKDLAWEKGLLKWKLRPEQVEIYDIFRGAKGLSFVIYCTRRIGKSFISYLMANEDAIQNEGWQIGFVAPTQKMLGRIFTPIHNTIYEDCPEHLKPKWNRELGAWVFPNKSIIYMSGTDDKRYEDLRGMNAHRVYFDEPGNMTDLDIIVYSIVQPQTLTTRKVRGDGIAMCFLGTPAKTPAHPYYYLKEKCKSEGNYVLKTIYDNSSLDEPTIDLYKKECEGDVNSSWEREYLCEDVVDKEHAIIPEFTEERQRKLVCDKDRPEFFVLYGAMDPGFTDMAAYLLGYYDFKSGNYVVEAEFWDEQRNTNEIAKGISDLEKKYFPNHKVYLRFCDTDPRLIADLSILHKIEFAPTRKDNKDAQVNYVRNMVMNERLYIHSRCKNLIRQMRCGVWNDHRSKFARVANEGHFDLLDALVYLLRNIDKHENPYPHPNDNLDKGNYYIPPYEREQKSHKALNDALVRL